MTAPILSTERLILRPWRAGDLEAFAALNADPRVMEFMPARLDRAASDSMVMQIRSHFDRHGYGLWAVEAVGVAPFIGFVGLSRPSFSAAFTPCVEVGWRLAWEHWGHGYATEAAAAALEFGFESAKLSAVVSFTVPRNARSRAVMERLGMSRDSAEDFDHPNLPEGHALRRHVLYRLDRRGWAGAAILHG